MFYLRAYGPSEAMAEMGEGLERSALASHVALAPGVRPGHTLLIADVSPDAADAVLDMVHERGVPPDDVALGRIEEIGRAPSGRGQTSLIWADVLGQAARHARPVARYLALMTVAGVIAAFGVIEVNQTLIVGAMAVSPDILPLTAVCVGLVSRRGALAWRAFVTLVVGLVLTCGAAAALSALLNLLDLLEEGFVVGTGALAGLATVNAATIGVALAAGVAGMLAFETRAGAAVGVAISVTTIPAAAYLGVAAGVGEVDKVPGALEVLAVNVGLLMLAGTATLLLQRRWQAHEAWPWPR
jgi:uncharacterized hydrophobic protein (TIGR00271 family)